MAKLDVELGNFESMFAAIADVDEIAQELLDDASAPLVSSMKQHAAKHSRTGDMASSIKASKVKKFKNGGHFVTVGPSGKSTKYSDRTGKLRQRNKDISNAEKLIHLEYGTSKQPKTPIIENAVRDSQDRCAEILQKKYNEFVAKKGG